MKDIFQEALDLEGLKDVLRKIRSGEIKCIAVDTPVPSVFSHEILNSNPYAFLDDAPLEERRARAVEMRRTLPESVLQEVGALDPAAIAEVRADAWPDVRDADELADTLQTLIALPENFQPSDHPAPAEAWQGMFELLRRSNRATRARVDAQPGAAAVHNENFGAQAPSPADDKFFWVPTEKAKAFTAIYPDAQFEDQLPVIDGEIPSPEDARKAMVTGWLTHLGPTTASALASLLHLPVAEIDKTLLRIETTGLILRGTFDKTLGEDTQWSERRLLARIHRLTLGTLRKQIEPVTAATFMRWLLRWQHVSPGSQARAEHGTLQVLRQLQGFEIPASAWERHVLARRISNYDPKLLDQLCLTGAVGWGRLSPHPAMLEDSSGNGRRVVPTSVAPITFFVRDEAEWMALPSVRSANRDAEQEVRGLGPSAREVLTFLRTRGASFFADIVRGTDKLKSEIETALWELVAGGLVTADGFDNLRALIDPKRRSGQGSGKSIRPRHSAGRWSLLYPPHVEDGGKSVESVCRVCWSATAWFSASCWCVKACCRAGVTCSSHFVGWKIAAKFAADALSVALLANNLLCRLRLNLCGR